MNQQNNNHPPLTPAQEFMKTFWLMADNTHMTRRERAILDQVLEAVEKKLEDCHLQPLSANSPVTE